MTHGEITTLHFYHLLDDRNLPLAARNCGEQVRGLRCTVKPATIERPTESGGYSFFLNALSRCATFHRFTKWEEKKRQEQDRSGKRTHVCAAGKAERPSEPLGSHVCPHSFAFRTA
jgi:hypothetical protein